MSDQQNWPVSSWYVSLANYTFPTVFIRMNDKEKEALLNKKATSAASKALIETLESFSRCSGLNLNTNKSVILMLSPNHR